MTFLLETPRLILRPFQDSDLETFFAYRNDPEVAKYQGWDFPYPREKAVEFMDFMKSAVPAAPGEWYQAALELKVTREVVGDVAFFIKKDDHRQARVGYSIARPHWRKGYAVESMRRLLDYLFDDLKLHRVIAECVVENTASRALLEKLGFRRESHLIENVFFKGRYGSEYHYAMLEREWKSKA